MVLHNAAVTGSLTVNGVDVSSITGSSPTSASFAAQIASLNTATASLNNYTSSNNTNISALNAQSASFLAYTSSNDVRVAGLNTFSSSILSYTSSNDANIASIYSTTSSLNSYTSSANTRFAGLDAASGSAITRLNALEVASGSAITRLGALETASGSAINRLNALETASGSAITRLTSLENRTGSYATTGSNTFVGGQYFSSSFNPVGFTTTASLYTDGGLRVTRDMYVSGTAYFNNITVFGTQSVAYISSSQLNIGTNIISVNTDTPSVRFGGLAVYDSGSTGLTGSMLWDSQDNQWIYSNPSGSAYDSAMFLVGPRNSGVLGNEAGINCNFLSKGNGMHHMTSSGIFEDGSRTCFYGNASISSAGAACLAGTICSPSMDVMPSGIGSSTLGGIMRVVTAGTSTGIAVGQSNANRYTHIAANDIQVFNDDFFLSTRCAFPLSIGTCYTARLTFAATGVACFACRVCVPQLIINANCIINPNNSGAEIWNGEIKFGGTMCIYQGQPNGAFSDRTDLVFVTNTGFGLGVSEKMRLAAGGNLGIGTNNPSAKLTLEGSANNVNSEVRIIATGVASGYLGSNSNGFNIGTDTGGIIFKTDVIGGSSVGNTGTERMRITSTGNAQFSLPNSGNSVSTGNITLISTATAVNDRLTINFSQTGILSRARVGMGSVAEESSGYAASLAFYTRNAVDGSELNIANERMRITSGGNVGIGISCPSALLHMDSPNSGATGQEMLRITRNSASQGIRLLNYNGDTGVDGYSLRTIGSTELIHFKMDGNVGIGYISPVVKLDVAGIIATRISQFTYSTIDGATDGNLYITANAGSANTTNSNIIFRSSTSGGSVTERMRIRNDGVIRITSGGISNSATLELTSDATPSNGSNISVSYLGTGAYGPLSFSTGGSERMRITSTGIACFACQVCSPLYIGSLRGQATIAKAVGSMNNGGGSQLIYLTSNVNVGYGINDYSITVFAAGNSAEQSSVRALAAYGYYASSVNVTELSKYIDNSQGHSQISFGICKASGSSNTYCYAVCFAKSSGVISGYCVNVVKNSSSAGDAGDMSLY
jgi:hypothetical protein